MKEKMEESEEASLKDIFEDEMDVEDIKGLEPIPVRKTKSTPA